MENYSWPKSKSKTSSAMVAGLKGRTSEHLLNKRVAAQGTEEAAFAILGDKDVRAACP